MRTSKDPIKLRRRKLKNGNVSLYLDLCIDNRREYEFLKLYLIPERTKADRDKNKETLALAETIRAKRIVELRNSRFGLQDTKPKSVPLLPLLDQLDCKNQSYIGIKSRILRIITDSTTTAVISPKWVHGLCDSISREQGIKQSTKHAYIKNLRYVLHRLADAHLIQADAVEACENVRNEQSVREFLTADELRRLVATPWKREDIRRMFLFSCFSGLRKSDVERLTWANVEDTKQGSRIVFRQKKTKDVVYTAINADARGYLGKRGKDTERIFPIVNRTALNNNVRKWMRSAGISKHITFHCARHTFATLLISADTNIFVVSNLLGHRDVRTTQIYAKVVDEKKRSAVNALSALISDNGKVTESNDKVTE